MSGTTVVPAATPPPQPPPPNPGRVWTHRGDPVRQRPRAAAANGVRRVRRASRDLRGRREGHDPEGIRFFAEGVPVLCDPRLAAGTVETAILPSGW
jgi:hypothetical protein